MVFRREIIIPLALLFAYHIYFVYFAHILLSNLHFFACLNLTLVPFVCCLIH